MLANSQTPLPGLDAARQTLERVWGSADFRGLQARVVTEIMAEPTSSPSCRPAAASPSAIRYPPSWSPASVWSSHPDRTDDRPGRGVETAGRGRRPAQFRPVAGRAHQRPARRPVRGTGPALRLPEGLASGSLTDRLRDLPLSLIAIDEACVSSRATTSDPTTGPWAASASSSQGVPRIAVTATARRPHPRRHPGVAASRTRRRLRRQLRPSGVPAALGHPQGKRLARQDRRPCDRTRPRPEKAGSGSRLSRIARRLRAGRRRPEGGGTNAIACHAGMSGQERDKRLERFCAEDGAVRWSRPSPSAWAWTRRDVRFVIHADPPGSLEAYWQGNRPRRPDETGRGHHPVRPVRHRLDPETPRQPADGRGGQTGGRWPRRAGCSPCWTAPSVAPRRFAAISEKRTPATAASATSVRPARPLRRHSPGPEGPRGGPASRRPVRQGPDCRSPAGQDERRPALEVRPLHLGHRQGHRPDRLARHRRSPDVRGPAAGGPERRQATGRPRRRRARPCRLSPAKSPSRSAHAARLRRRNPFRRSETRTRNDRNAAVEALDADVRARFETLRAWRRDRAEQHVPPYVIFQDKTLLEIAQREPGSLDALAAISGSASPRSIVTGKAFWPPCSARPSRARRCREGPASRRHGHRP